MSQASITLDEFQLFDGLDEAAKQVVAQSIRWKRYDKGVEVVAYQEDSDEVYFLASGKARVTIFSYNGKEISYEDLETGATFGELSAIDRLPRTANVITLKESVIGTVSRETFWGLIEQYPGIGFATMQRLAGMVRFLVDRVYQYGALDVKDRIRAEILRLARENPNGDDGASIDNFPTHREIASRVNTHREAVTKELNELGRLGLIEQDKRVMRVTSVSGLSDMISEDL